ncbi:MAG TPA: ATP cone domain-containing protein [Nitrososphaera sp.]|nr:ATP cone domain-containing protein [Nitrososphaera sp.]
MAKKTRKNKSSISKNKQRTRYTIRNKSKDVNSKKKKSVQSAKASDRSRQRRTKPDIVIRRSSGRKEKFDADRMAQTTSRSGVPFLMARDIAKNVSKKIKSEARAGRKEKTVTAGRVRNMVTKELKERNRTAIASSYSGEQPENSRQGRHDLVRDNQPMHDAEAANMSKLRYDSSSHLAKTTRASSMKS